MALLQQGWLQSHFYWVFNHECRKVIPEIVISAVRYASMSPHTGPHPCVLPKDLILSCHAQAPTWGTILARRLSIPEHVINPLHDPLCPLNAGCYEPIRAWAALRGSKQIICRPHVHRRQDRCHNSNHPLSAFVHAGQDTTFALYSPEESW